MFTPALSFEAAVTAIACLCSTNDVRESQISTLLSWEHLTVPETGFWAQQPKKLQNLEERLHKMETKFAAIKQLMSEHQKLPPPLESCTELSLENEAEKLVQYDLPNSKPFLAICKNAHPYGNWLLIQRRFNGKENFNRDWEAYKNGFGHIREEFFMGLERLHQLTKATMHELLIRLKWRKREAFWVARYNYFEIDSESEGYNLKGLGTYNGTAGDALRTHMGHKFSTHDRDHDDLSSQNCAAVYRSGWWFTDCLISNLNGLYYANGKADQFAAGIVWQQSAYFDRSAIISEMYIRPVTKEVDLWDL